MDPAAFEERALTRRSLLRLLAAAIAGLATMRVPLAPALARPRPRGAMVRKMVVTTSGGGFRGDRRMFATLKSRKGRPGFAFLDFRLDRAAKVTVQALRTGIWVDTPVWGTEEGLKPGRHRIVWRPDPNLPARSYLLRITTETPEGIKGSWGVRPVRRRNRAGPVVRILGIEAAWLRRSYTGSSHGFMRISAVADALTVQFFRAGPEQISTNRIDDMTGVPVSEPVTLDWRRKGVKPHLVKFAIGEWPFGVYFARLTADDGRVGFAPFVLRPRALGASKVAVVVPTNTWQAYNFRDTDGDGWGDTWYQGGSPPVLLNRPFLDRGVPPRYKHHDRFFLQWLARTEKQVDFLADDDLERVPSGDQLRLWYDLVVFPGHSEYMTQRAYDVVTRFRDLGGNLLFLSANNFFWCVRKRGQAMRRHALWRNLGRPEAALIGTQYKANDNGRTQRPFVVRNSGAASWLWAGTGLSEGSTFGEQVGGFGTEIDMVSPGVSPPETIVVAEIPDVFGPGLTAQMTYYESPTGARVFAAGVLDFGGSVMFPPMRQLLENVWERLASGY
jgi:hypothetical protein